MIAHQLGSIMNYILQGGVCVFRCSVIEVVYNFTVQQLAALSHTHLSLSHLQVDPSHDPSQVQGQHPLVVIVDPLH